MDERTYCHEISNAGDHVVDAKGDLVRDYGAVLTRARVRLRCRRGQYVFDPLMGSRFHEIRTLREAKQKVLAMAEEALQPLFDEGALDSVELVQVELDDRTGFLGAELAVWMPDGERVELGEFQVGG